LEERIGPLERFRIFLHSREFRFMEKWIPLSIIIGFLSGLGAVAFELILEKVYDIFLYGIAGFYEPPTGIESLRYVMPRPSLPLLVVSLALGAFLSAAISLALAPEAGGEGTDAAIEAFHYKDAQIRARVPFVKLFTSSLTIGSGGSAGKEGPIAQIGGGFGAALIDLLHLTPKDRRLALAIGMGSGIGAIFKAPFGGALLSSELFYISDFEPEALPPAFIASIVSYGVFAWVFSLRPMFVIPDLSGLVAELNSPLMLLIFGLLGLVNGLLGFVYIFTYQAVEGFFEKLPAPRLLKPVLGAALVAALGWYAPQILGGGYGWIQLLLLDDLRYFPIYLLLLLPFLKILATSLTIGSGGSGGVFAPTLVIGSFTGALFWSLLKLYMPGFNLPLAPFVVLGMMSYLGGAGKVPISVILMVSEMTNGYVLFAPSLISTTIAYVVTGDMSIFPSQVYSRGESPAHEESRLGLLHILIRRVGIDHPLFTRTRVKEAMVKPILVFRCSDTVADAISRALRTPHRTFPVVDDQGRFLGLVELQDLLELPEDRLDIELCYVDIHKIPTIEADATLRDAIDRMFDYESDRLAVVDGEGRLLGLLTVKEIIRLFAHRKLSVRERRRRRPG